MKLCCWLREVREQGFRGVYSQPVWSPRGNRGRRIGPHTSINGHGFTRHNWMPMFPRWRRLTP